MKGYDRIGKTFQSEQNADNRTTTSRASTKKINEWTDGRERMNNNKSIRIRITYVDVVPNALFHTEYRAVGKQQIDISTCQHTGLESNPTLRGKSVAATCICTSLHLFIRFKTSPATTRSMYVCNSLKSEDNCRQGRT